MAIALMKTVLSYLTISTTKSQTAANFAKVYKPSVS